MSFDVGISIHSGNNSISTATATATTRRSLSRITDTRLEKGLVIMKTIVRIGNCVAIAVLSNIIVMCAFSLYLIFGDSTEIFIAAITGADQICNCICLLFQFPFAIPLYLKFCAICDNFMKKCFITKALSGSQ